MRQVDNPDSQAKLNMMPSRNSTGRRTSGDWVLEQQLWSEGVLDQFWYKMACQAGVGIKQVLKTKLKNGGRAGTRTPDLLRVKQAL